MKYILKLLILPFLILLTNCETTPNQRVLDETPKWFNKLPKSKKFIYTRGTAVSSDIQIAYDKAKLNAKRSLADQLQSLISAKTKTFAKESGLSENSQTYEELETTTINTVKEAAIIGFKEYKSKSVAISGKYRIYYVAEYPVKTANKVLVNQIKQKKLLQGQLNASKAYKDLEAEINRN